MLLHKNYVPVNLLTVQVGLKEWESRSCSQNTLLNIKYKIIKLKKDKNKNIFQNARLKPPTN